MSSGVVQDPTRVIQNLESHMEGYLQVCTVASKFFERSSHLFRNRFCVTKGGRTAVVPPRTQEGDIICVLKGASMPFLLRRQGVGPQGEAFKLIGSCYVHGLMERAWTEDTAKSFLLV